MKAKISTKVFLKIKLLLFSFVLQKPRRTDCYSFFRRKLHFIRLQGLPSLFISSKTSATIFSITIFIIYFPYHKNPLYLLYNQISVSYQYRHTLIFISIKVLVENFFLQLVFLFFRLHMKNYILSKKIIMNKKHPRQRHRRRGCFSLFYPASRIIHNIFSIFFHTDNGISRRNHMIGQLHIQAH